MSANLPVKLKELQKYLESIYKSTVEIVSIQYLTGEEAGSVKEFGYGKPLLIVLDIGKSRDKIVLHTVRPGKYGHERRSDRAQNVILDFDNFNELNKHVPAIGLGAFTEDQGIVNLSNSEEFFLLTQFVPGRPYAEDLINISGGRELQPDDHQRALSLADYLAKIHSEKMESRGLYHRTVRDLLGHGEGIMGLIDSYPKDFSVAPESRLSHIEKRLIDCRWLLKKNPGRLSQVHGDFHPWNILFRKNNDFSVLDRSRGMFGDPADDVSALSINYIFFSLQQTGTFGGAFRVLFDLFWEHYLQNSQDVSLNSVIQPFFVWRALVLAHPGWYPNLKESTYRKLFTFIENVLEEEWFDPQEINQYLGVE